jgi:pyrroline-5-carboxylate reductase
VGSEEYAMTQPALPWTLDGPLVLVGAGKMGAAMLAGWLGAGLNPDQAVVVEPHPSTECRALCDEHGVHLFDDIKHLPPVPPSLIVMAVKPQMMADVFPAIALRAGAATVTLSIAAGRTIASFAAHLPPGSAVVRAMPNTPAAIGRGMTVLCANAATTAAQRALCERLMAAVGEVGWVADEALMDAVTAVSGSGPAYVFHLVEALAAAGVAAGLEPALAMQLARATVSGSGELLHRSDQDASTLRQNVTSPGGTTAAALSVLMARDGLPALMERAVAAAVARGRELATYTKQ